MTAIETTLDQLDKLFAAKPHIEELLKDFAHAGKEDPYKLIRLHHPEWLGHRPQREVHRGLSQAKLPHRSHADLLASQRLLYRYFKQVWEIT